MTETGIVNKREAAQAAAVLIREASCEGRLIPEGGLRAGLAEKGFDTAGLDVGSIVEGRGLPEDAMQDLRALASVGGERHYYSSEAMTEVYALLLLRKKSDRTALIAEVVRESSAAYPRPVPLDVFAGPPFDLPAEDVKGEVERMGVTADYKDIAQTATSTGRVFLYSTLHMEPDHASMLAEWIDVGQSNNP